MDWIQWVFSGIGVTALTIIGGLLFKKKSQEKNYQNIISGNNSTNVQGGNDVKVTIGDRNVRK
jgi:hypothetical protein